MNPIALFLFVFGFGLDLWAFASPDWWGVLGFIGTTLIALGLLVEYVTTLLNRKARR